MAAFEGYYAKEAETWEYLALTRARIVWSSSPAFAADAGAAIEAALRRPRDPVRTAKDVKAMRALMEKERPPKGFWDLKLTRGGLVDIEFAAQFLQIVHAGEGGPLRVHTGEALAALRDAGLAGVAATADMEAAWRLQQDLSQVLKVALPEAEDPSQEPEALRALLAKAGRAESFQALTETLKARRTAAREAYDGVLA